MNFFAGAAGSIPAANFAKRLIEKMPGMSRVYFSNSGSEANEKGFKMIRQIAHKKYGGKKNKILYRERDYHGTTIATLAAGGQHERSAAQACERRRHADRTAAARARLARREGAPRAREVEEAGAQAEDILGGRCGAHAMCS